MNGHFFPRPKFLAFAALAVSTLVADGPAQTVRPVIVQYDGTARGKFELVNNGLRPVNVILKPRGFTVTEDGKGIYQPLASEIHLKLSASSFRIPPRQSRFVFYEAHADGLPAWFVIYSVFAGATRQSSVNIQIELPHTVYLLQKESLKRQDVSVESARYLPDQRRAVILLANKSSKLGRVLEWQIGSKRNKNSNAGFPLLPRSRRRLEVEWDGPGPPDMFWIHFEHFSLAEELSASPN